MAQTPKTPPSVETDKTNGTADQPGLTAAQAQQVVELRGKVREAFGSIAMSMMLLPRYRNQTVADLQHLVLEPLLNDRIAIAYPAGKKAAAQGEDGDSEQAAMIAADMVGFAIWASVSEEVDARIREQISAGTFPVRLKADEWTGGDHHWILDIVAPTKAAAAKVLQNFGQLTAKDGTPKEGLKLHPQVARMLDEETLVKMGAKRVGDV